MADKENVLAGGAPDTADTKRQRMSDALPELGSDASEFLPERGLLLRHGTSLQRNITPPSVAVRVASTHQTPTRRAPLL